MSKLIKRFWADESGIELSEYAVMLALIVVALFVAILYLSGAIAARFSHTASNIATAQTPADVTF